MTDPRMLKGVGYVLLVVALVMIALAMIRDGNNMWLSLAAVVPALTAVALFTKADPERYRKKKA